VTMSVIDVVLGFLAGVASSLVASYFFPRFRRAADTFFSSLALWLNPQRFSLTGTWEQTFDEPLDKKGIKKVTETETIRITHGFSSITGVGRTQNRPRDFNYDLRVLHHLVDGSYSKVATQGNIAGTGTIQMTISDDRLRMIGHTTWLDRDTGKIESSQVEWKKIS
jgi:hypothetical protein